jgi:hypothetical protein
MTTNLWTVGQGLITRRLIPKVAAPALPTRRSSRTAPKEEAEAPAPATAAAAAPTPKPTGQPRRVKRKKKKARR